MSEEKNVPVGRQEVKEHEIIVICDHGTNNEIKELSLKEDYKTAKVERLILKSPKDVELVYSYLQKRHYENPPLVVWSLHGFVKKKSLKHKMLVRNEGYLDTQEVLSEVVNSLSYNEENTFLQIVCSCKSSAVEFSFPDMDKKKKIAVYTASTSRAVNIFLTEFLAYITQKMYIKSIKEECTQDSIVNKAIAAGSFLANSNLYFRTVAGNELEVQKIKLYEDWVDKIVCETKEFDATVFFESKSFQGSLLKGRLNLFLNEDKDLIVLIIKASTVLAILDKERLPLDFAGVMNNMIISLCLEGEKLKEFLGDKVYVTLLSQIYNSLVISYDKEGNEMRFVRKCVSGITEIHKKILLMANTGNDLAKIYVGFLSSPRMDGDPCFRNIVVSETLSYDQLESSLLENYSVENLLFLRSLCLDSFESVVGAKAGEIIETVKKKGSVGLEKIFNELSNKYTKFLLSDKDIGSLILINEIYYDSYLSKMNLQNKFFTKDAKRFRVVSVILFDLVVGYHKFLDKKDLLQNIFKRFCEVQYSLIESAPLKHKDMITKAVKLIDEYQNKLGLDPVVKADFYFKIGKLEFQGKSQIKNYLNEAKKLYEKAAYSHDEKLGLKSDSDYFKRKLFEIAQEEKSEGGGVEYLEDIYNKYGKLNLNEKVALLNFYDNKEDKKFEAFQLAEEIYMQSHNGDVGLKYARYLMYGLGTVINPQMALEVFKELKKQKGSFSRAAEEAGEYILLLQKFLSSNQPKKKLFGWINRQFSNKIEQTGGQSVKGGFIQQNPWSVAYQFFEGNSSNICQDKKDNAEGEKDLINNANRGDLNSILKLARKYLYEDFAKKENLFKAYHYLSFLYFNFNKKRAAPDLVYCLEKGIGCKYNQQKAYKILNDEFQQGEGEANCVVLRHYYKKHNPAFFTDLKLYKEVEDLSTLKVDESKLNPEILILKKSLENQQVQKLKDEKLSPPVALFQYNQIVKELKDKKYRESNFYENNAKSLVAIRGVLSHKSFAETRDELEKYLGYCYLKQGKYDEVYKVIIKAVQNNNDEALKFLIEKSLNEKIIFSGYIVSPENYRLFSEIFKMSSGKIKEFDLKAVDTLDKGDIENSYNFAKCLLTERSYGREASRNSSETNAKEKAGLQALWFLATKANHAKSYLKLAEIYQEYQKNIKDEFYSLYKSAYRLGGRDDKVKALIGVADCFSQGIGGVQKNVAEAMRICLKLYNRKYKIALIGIVRTLMDNPEVVAEYEEKLNIQNIFQELEAYAWETGDRKAIELLYRFHSKENNIAGVCNSVSVADRLAQFFQVNKYRISDCINPLYLAYLKDKKYSIHIEDAYPDVDEEKGEYKEPLSMFSMIGSVTNLSSMLISVVGGGIYYSQMPSTGLPTTSVIGGGNNEDNVLNWVLFKQKNTIGKTIFDLFLEEFFKTIRNKYVQGQKIEVFKDMLECFIPRKGYCLNIPDNFYNNVINEFIDNQKKDSKQNYENKEVSEVLESYDNGRIANYLVFSLYVNLLHLDYSYNLDFGDLENESFEIGRDDYFSAGLLHHYREVKLYDDAFKNFQNQTKELFGRQRRETKGNRLKSKEQVRELFDKDGLEKESLDLEGQLGLKEKELENKQLQIKSVSKTVKNKDLTKIEKLLNERTLRLYESQAMRSEKSTDWLSNGKKLLNYEYGVYFAIKQGKKNIYVDIKGVETMEFKKFQKKMKEKYDHLVEQSTNKITPDCLEIEKQISNLKKQISDKQNAIRLCDNLEHNVERFIRIYANPDNKISDRQVFYEKVKEDFMKHVGSNDYSNLILNCKPYGVEISDKDFSDFVFEKFQAKLEDKSIDVSVKMRDFELRMPKKAVGTELEYPKSEIPPVCCVIQ